SLVTETAHSKDEAQCKKKAADNNEDPGGGGRFLAQTEDSYSSSSASNSTNTTSFPPCDLNNKYLHKKFKKMATASDDVAAVTMVNGGGTTTTDTEGGAAVKAPSRGASPSSVAPQGRYVCPYCRLPCAKPSVLQKHIRAHTNERPYPCDACGFAFKTKSNLYKHCRSRAHALKMEEEGSNSAAAAKFNLPSAESSDVEDDEDESLTPPPASSTPHLDPASTAAAAPTSETNNNSEKPRPIYKPKFHRVAMYKEEEAAMNPPSPSPEFLQQHISKIISDNRAIVETDPHWSKKFLQRQSSREAREGSPASPLSPMSSPGIDLTSSTSWPKRHIQRTLSLSEQPGGQQQSSRLAFALLRPPRHESSSLSPRPSESPLSAASSTPEPVPTYHQPLNLTTTSQHPNNKLIAEDAMHRKRCYSEGFPGRASIPSTTVLKDILPNSDAGGYLRGGGQSNSKHARLDNAYSGGMTLLDSRNIALKEKLLYHPQNPEGSIIKDLLLKARAEAAAIAATSYADLHSGNAPYLPSSTTEEDVYIENSQYVCSLCDVHFRNAQNLEAHQRFYCKGDNSRVLNAVSSPQHSPNAAMKYGPATAHSLEFPPQAIAGVDENVNILGSSSKHSSIRTFQPLSIIKVSPKIGKHDYKSSPLTPPAREGGKGTLVVPPFPSPGPLLGSTPLVESYHPPHISQKKREETDSEEMLEDIHRRGPVLKKRRLDSEVSRDTSSTTSSPDIRPLSTTPLSGIMSPSTTTLRSLEELSKCPMRPNSLQMFGGEVQILDGAGETKTMRIEPSSRGGKSPGATGSAADLILTLPNHIHSALSSTGSKAGTSEPDGEVVAGNVSPQIVVTIARCGFNSGGTIVQVPQKSSNTTVSTGLMKTPRTSTGISTISSPSSKSISSPLPKQKGISGGMIVHSSPSTSPYCTGALITSNTNTVTNTFPDTTKLLVPIVPNIATPNLTVPGIPAPNLGHHMPFIPFASILPDGTLFNPLTSITAFNPLTLPPHTGIVHQTPHMLHAMSLPQPPLKERKSPGGLPSSPVSRDATVPPPPYTVGVGTILHGGKAIPYVPGMPGPDTLLASGSLPVGSRKDASPKPLDLASPSRDSLIANKRPDLSISLLSKSVKACGTPSTNTNVTTTCSIAPHPSSHHQKDELPRIVNSKVPSNALLRIPKTPTLIPSIKVDAAGPDIVEHLSDDALMRHTPPLRKNSKGSRPDVLPLLPTKEVCKEKEDKEAEDGRANKTESAIDSGDESKSKGNKPKFLRPTTLPLKPGTFIPKKHHGTGLTPTGPVLSLVSPETPRPRKSYGQLYLNGHAYTYLGLKCSTRAYYCTLNRPQPMYVLQSPEHSKLSMYSNWKVCQVEPNPFGLDPGCAMALYDSRHRPATYTIAKPPENKPMVLTHSSYWVERSRAQQIEKAKASEKKSDAKWNVFQTLPATGESAPRRVKIFDGGFESNEDYIYVRGRGRGRYVCEECGIRCKKPSMLKKHIRTHTDVRPFTCKHCNFSFKTKGNLTKHMKSKAHYKKCMELGIQPVPTIVDDSYIDEECLARQEEEDDEDEEEEEDEEQNQGDGDEGNVTKGKLEREAACSLLSLSESTRVNSTSSQYISAGLIPLSSSCGRPTTYPYIRTLPIPGPNCPTSAFSTPQTPTLIAVSAQTEREKVSRNTGLALELRSGGESKLKEEEDRTIRRRGNAPTLVLIPPQQGDANRYYFPSCRTPTIATSIPVTPFSKSPPEDLSSDTGSDSDELDMSLDEEDFEKSVSSTRASVPADVSGRSDGETGTLQPMDLSNKMQPAVPKKSAAAMIPFFSAPLSTNGARTPTTPISEILTPVSEPATLLASLCSSVERFPVSTHKTPDPAETTMLQAYLTERALQDVRMKQHQFHHNHSTTVHETRPLPFQKPPHEKEAIEPPQPSSVPEKPIEEPESEGDKMKVATSGENVTSKMNLVPMSSNNIVRNVVVCGIGFTGHQPASPPTSSSGAGGNKNVSPAKPKAEFLPPSSGPSPSYVSMTEDGRSICVICNKIFSKPSQLRLHVNIHYFERPFRCESCAVSFRTKGHLQKHERSVSHQNKVSMNSTFGTPTTTNPRPFKCDDCKIAFRIHGHLAKHLRSKMHIMKLECVGKLPFGTYAEMEREGISLNEIDTTDCDNSLESLQVLAQKLYEKDPSKLGQWDGERGELLPAHPLPPMSGGETSSDEGEPLMGCQSPPGIQEVSADVTSSENISNQDMQMGANSHVSDSSLNERREYNYDKIEETGPYSTDADVVREGVLSLSSPAKSYTSMDNCETRARGSREFVTDQNTSAMQHTVHGETARRRSGVGEDAPGGDNGCCITSVHLPIFPSLGDFQIHKDAPLEEFPVIEPTRLNQTPGSPIVETRKHYLSQFRKRLAMTENCKEMSFPKRPLVDQVPNAATERAGVRDASGENDTSNQNKTCIDLSEKAPNNGTKYKRVVGMCVVVSGSSVECQKSEESAKSDDRRTLEGEQQKKEDGRRQTKLNCDLCGKVQSSPESLQKHLLSHAQPRPFVCEFCDAGFISQHLLQSHLSIHQETNNT
ncbi:hypothetical protein C0J52_12964, partial [Blattella germanica]